MSSAKFSIGIFGGLFPSKVDETGGLEGAVSLAIRTGLHASSKVLESERFVIVKAFRLIDLSSITDGGAQQRRRRRLLNGATQGVEFDIIAYSQGYSLIKNASTTLSSAIKAGPSNSDIAAMLYNTALAANIPPPLSIRLTKSVDLFDRFPSPSPSPPPPISPEGWGALWGGLAGALVLFGAVGLSWRIVTIRNKKSFAAAKELEFLETNKKAFERINRLAVQQGRIKLSKEEQEALDKQDAEDEEKMKKSRSGASKEKIGPKSPSNAPTSSDSIDGTGRTITSTQQITLHFDEDDFSPSSSSSANMFKDLPFGLSFGGTSSSSSSSSSSSFQGSNPMVSPSRSKKFESMQSTRFGTQIKARGGREAATSSNSGDESSTSTSVQADAKNNDDNEFGPTKSRNNKPRLSRLASSRRQMNSSSSSRRVLGGVGAGDEISSSSSPSSSSSSSSLKRSLGAPSMSSRFLSLVGLGSLPRPSSFSNNIEEEEEENANGGSGNLETVSGINPMKLERKPTAAPAALVRTKSELRQARQAAMIKPKMLEKEAKINSLIESDKAAHSGFFGQVFGLNTSSSSSSSSSSSTASSSLEFIVGGVNPMLAGTKQPSSSSSSSSTTTDESNKKREKIEAHHYLEKDAKELRRRKEEEEEMDATGSNVGGGVGVISTLVRGFFRNDDAKHNATEGDEDFKFAAANPMRAPPHSRSKASFDALPTQQRLPRNTGMSRRNLSLFSSSSPIDEVTSKRVKVTSPHYLEKEAIAVKRNNALGIDPFASPIPEEEERGVGEEASTFESSNPMKQMKQLKQKQKDRHNEIKMDEEETTNQRLQVQPRFLEKEARLTAASTAATTISTAEDTAASLYPPPSMIEGETFSGLNPMVSNIELRTAAAPPPLQQQRPIVGGGLVGRGKKAKKPS